MKRTVKIICCAVLLTGMACTTSRTASPDSSERVTAFGHVGAFCASAVLTLVGLRDLFYGRGRAGKFISTGLPLLGGASLYYLDREKINPMVAGLAEKIINFAPNLKPTERLAIGAVALSGAYVASCVVPYGVMGLRQWWSKTALQKEYDNLNDQKKLASKILQIVEYLKESVKAKKKPKQHKKAKPVAKKVDLKKAEKLIRDFVAGKGAETMPFVPTIAGLKRAYLFKMGDNPDRELRYFGGDSLLDALGVILNAKHGDKLSETINTAAERLTSFLTSCSGYEIKLQSCADLFGIKLIKKQSQEDVQNPKQVKEEQIEFK